MPNNLDHNDQRLCLSCLATVSEFDAECPSCGLEFAGSNRFARVACEGPSELFLQMFSDRLAPEAASSF